MPARGPLRRLKDKVSASLGGRSSGRSGRAPADGAPVGDPPNLGTGGPIAVRYAPNRNGVADPGEVVWTWVPFEDDPTQGKDRPVLVLGWDGPLLAAVQLSSKDHADRADAREWVEVGRGTWDREFRISYADASRLLRVDPSAVRREGGELDRWAFDAVVAKVAELHDWQR